MLLRGASIVRDFGFLRRCSLIAGPLTLSLARLASFGTVGTIRVSLAAFFTTARMLVHECIVIIVSKPTAGAEAFSSSSNRSIAHLLGEIPLALPSASRRRLGLMGCQAFCVIYLHPSARLLMRAKPIVLALRVEQLDLPFRLARRQVCPVSFFQGQLRLFLPRQTIVVEPVI